MPYKLKFVKIKPKKQKQEQIKPKTKDVVKSPINPKINDFYENEIIRLQNKKALLKRKKRYYELKAEVEPNIWLSLWGYNKKKRKDDD